MLPSTCYFNSSNRNRIVTNVNSTCQSAYYDTLQIHSIQLYITIQSLTMLQSLSAVVNLLSYKCISSNTLLLMIQSYESIPWSKLKCTFLEIRLLDLSPKLIINIIDCNYFLWQFHVYTSQNLCFVVKEFKFMAPS